ncbi:hypothetical protein E2C01_074665 [Portunus trituberculatus]|uniref:Uncharacterized protein n=1 Tax=Portunus trituberculatus TaxID=210409 RepID=A0A5B7IE32_PORTR|nr:hypothetical protein [Portunus trituberculatus]
MTPVTRRRSGHFYRPSWRQCQVGPVSIEGLTCSCSGWTPPDTVGPKWTPMDAQGADGPAIIRHLEVRSGNNEG